MKLYIGKRILCRTLTKIRWNKSTLQYDPVLNRWCAGKIIGHDYRRGRGFWAVKGSFGVDSYHISQIKEAR